MLTCKASPRSPTRPANASLKCSLRGHVIGRYCQPVFHQRARDFPTSEDSPRREAGARTRRGPEEVYELDPAGVDELARWIIRIRSFWSEKLDALEEELRK